MTPDNFTIDEHMLPVGNGHKIYIYDWGKKDAKLPVLFLHGGPGGATNDKHKQRYDPTRQRVIFFDQRGAGKSTPIGSLAHNTTNELVEDIEKIAEHMQLNKFIIAGGSWGSCLALVYAIRYPKRIHSMVLGGIFTGTKEEVSYLFNGGYKKFFPEVWQTFLDRTPKEYHKNPAQYHYKMAFGNNSVKAKKSIYAMAEVEHSLMSLDDRHSPCNFEEFEPDAMKIELFYTLNNCFLPNKYIEKNADKINVPTWFVQGRYDAICPPHTAFEISNLMPDCKLIWTTAGHANDRANYDVARTILLAITQ